MSCVVGADEINGECLPFPCTTGKSTTIAPSLLDCRAVSAPSKRIGDRQGRFSLPVAASVLKAGLCSCTRVHLQQLPAPIGARTPAIAESCNPRPLPPPFWPPTDGPAARTSRQNRCFVPRCVLACGRGNKHSPARKSSFSPSVAVLSPSRRLSLFPSIAHELALSPIIAHPSFLFQSSRRPWPPLDQTFRRSHPPRTQQTAAGGAQPA